MTTATLEKEAPATCRAKATASGTRKASARKASPASDTRAKRASTAPKRKGAAGKEEASSTGASKGMRSKELGRRGEEAAARFLVHRGYEILERNWECVAGEADIIARDERVLVFVEVKTRSDCEMGFPAEAVTAKKRERYERIACMYLQDHDMSEMLVRFDVISLVAIAPDRALVRHHINAWSGTDK